MGAIQKAAQGRIITPAQSTVITFEDSHGDDITITSDDVRQLICPQANQKEIAYFMELCRAMKLNPFLNEAYLVKYGNGPAQILVAHKSLLKRAEANPKYDGMEHGVIVMRNGEIHTEQRSAYYPEAGETLIGGWAKVYRSDRRVPVYREVSLRSMDKKQANWKTMPDIMIDKCAQAAALREAFPDDLSGMYAREEGEQAQQVESTTEDVPPVATTKVAQAVVERQPERLTEADMEWLKEASEQCATLGYDLNETKRYLWGIAKSGDMEAVRVAVSNMVDKANAQVDVETGEIVEDVPDEIDLADEDIAFGEVE